MPKTTAPQGVFSPLHALQWLHQIANDGDLSPIASRAAIKLATTFADDAASTVISVDELAGALKVGRNTAFRALTTLRQRGHLAAEGMKGHALSYAPKLMEA